MFSCETWKIFKNIFFYRTPPVAAIVRLPVMTTISLILYFQVEDNGASYDPPIHNFHNNLQLQFLKGPRKRIRCCEICSLRVKEF